ncbi:YMGG-like glycine zipper-containing protein [Arcicella sp. LKC2W]|uniref:YMGG-like glycine zipper-containing protein n=1 Tax=Arcicella sp. LKC2W TaxID=2984198 RepID=UPI002B1EA5E1|nr:YMGG-like glycine zipper-containing protein [Arcicella sp. LKC2W]MEA5458435.1 YMGG-like glycine zipper-containing protein [Arcicella sp. LKC2W]
MKKVTIILTASYFLFACNDSSKKEIQEAKQMTIDSMQQQAQIREAKQSVIDSMTQQANIEKAKQYTIDSIKAVKQSQVNTLGSTTKISKPNAFSSSTNAPEEQTTTVVRAKKKKKKMSNVAKGAIIGAGVGALSGAVISRNNKPGKGAIIGGVIGAGVGAGTGAIIDKKQKGN